jgi:Nucleotidyl transferase AbiEii toxin, Type IV TA system
VIRSTPTFHRLELNCDNETVRVDVAVDSPPRRTTVDKGIGPTLDPLELAGRKLLALFDRAAPRDFADVYRLTDRFGQSAVVDMASEIDPGFDVTYLAVALDHAHQLRDDDFPIDLSEIAALRQWAAEWAQSIRSAQV